MTRDDRAGEALARAARVRAAIRSAIQRTRMEVAAVEDDNRALHAEIALMDRSAGRRLFVSMRTAVDRAAATVRHPIWTLRGASARLGAIGPLAAAGTAATHLVTRAHLLRLLPPLRTWSDRPSVEEAVHWIGPLTVRHRAREALFCHPNSGIEFRLSAIPQARIVTEIAISPHVWRERPPAIVFRLEVRSDSGGWSRAVERRLDVAARIPDRRWHTLRMSLPADLEEGSDIIVSLSTSVPAGSGTEHGWAVFGEPRLERKRAPGEVKMTLRGLASRVRRQGLGGALQAARDAAAATGTAEAYAVWCAAHTPSDADLEAMAREAQSFEHKPRFTVVMPVYNTDPSWLRAAIESVRKQVYPHWRLSIADDASTSEATRAVLREYESDPRIVVTYLDRNVHISEASNAALARADGDFVALLDHDDEYTPDALFQVARWLNEHPDADVIYSDEDKLDLAGVRCDPFFKPDWSPEHFLTCMYTPHLVVVRRSLVDAVGGFRRGYEGAQDYDLLLRLMERTSRIDHIPRILYHWRKVPQSTASAQAAKPWASDAGRLALEDYLKRNRIGGEVLPAHAPGVYRIKRAIIGTPLVSIVVPTAGRLRDVNGRQVDLVARGIRSVVQRTGWPHYEIVVVADAAGLQPETLKALEGVRHTVVTDEAPGFNFSRKVNLGVSRAAGDHLVLLNDDVEVISGEWLEAMLEWSQDPAIGAVGAKLRYPDGRLQHVGIVLGVAGVAAHAFHQHAGTSPGYASSALSIRNYSAVTAACMMTRRAVFIEASGFDETLPVDFNDIDYCLRLAQRGLRIVFTPHAELYHHESASAGRRLPSEEAASLMRERWAAVIDRDPYYNPNLTREATDYRLRRD
jgi:GT2 family glycosyltransferase